MKNRGQVQAEYLQVKTQVNVLREAAQSLRNIANIKLQENMAFLSQNWSGENATAFLNKESIIINDIEKQARQLSEAADALEAAAQENYEVQIRAIEIAETGLTRT